MRRLVLLLATSCATSSGHHQLPQCNNGDACFNVAVKRLLQSEDATGWLESACQQGHSGACLTLAAHAPERHKSELLEASCALGDVEGCSRLGKLRGETGLLEAACDDWPQACGWLGDLTEGIRGEGLLDLACAAHNGSACTRLALRLSEAEKRKAYLSQGCLAGDRDGCLHLALDTRDTDPARAISLSEALCELGCSSGCATLAELLIATADADVASGAALFDRMCGDGVGQACEALADLLLADEVVEPDLEAVALRLWEACEQGSGRACVRHAVMLHFGWGVEQNTSFAESTLASICVPSCADQLLDLAALGEVACTLSEDDCLLLEDSPAPLVRTVATLVETDTPSCNGEPPPRAFLERACTLSDLESCAQLDVERALLVAEQWCDNGRLAFCLFVADNRLIGDALPYLERACQLGHPASCGEVGWWYLEHDAEKRGLLLLRRACELHSSLACQRLERVGVPP